jgi:N-acyl amino acid synthase of PEP-CTERM/exosortase system
MSLCMGVDYLFALTEQRLANHLSALGFGPEQIGSPVDYVGWRVPSLMLPRGVIAGMQPELRPIYRFVEESVEEVLGPAQ